jgi:hypothetical protein
MITMKNEELPFSDLGQVMEEMRIDQQKIFTAENCIVLMWNNSAGYHIELSRVKDWADLCDWMLHLCGKAWMNPYRLRLFAEAVIREKKWKRSDA